MLPLPESQLLLMMPEPMLHAPNEVGVPAVVAMGHVLNGAMGEGGGGDGVRGGGVRGGGGGVGGGGDGVRGGEGEGGGGEGGGGGGEGGGGEGEGGGGGGNSGAGGGSARTPQSVQSVPSAHTWLTLPGPPSVHTPSRTTLGFSEMWPYE